jgi:hypothetical protein
MHGRKINMVSLEEYLDERERERERYIYIYRTTTTAN